MRFINAYTLGLVCSSLVLENVLLVGVEKDSIEEF